MNEQKLIREKFFECFKKQTLQKEKQLTLYNTVNIKTDNKYKDNAVNFFNKVKKLHKIF